MSFEVQRNSPRTGLIGRVRPIHCDHCNRICGDFAGGYGTAYARDGRAVRLCHPNVADRPDCYHLVTFNQHDSPCQEGCWVEDEVSTSGGTKKRHPKANV